MKIIVKTKEALSSNKAETMVEVTVAFLVLSIIMALFAQGMNFANKAENYAIDRSRDGDKAFKELLDTAINSTGSFEVNSSTTVSLSGKDDCLKLKKYCKAEGSDIIVFYVFDAN